jgi:hypothetical protein
MTEKPNLRWRIRQSHLPPPEQAMVELLQTTVPLSHVVPTDYVVERLVYRLLERTRPRSTGSTDTGATNRYVSRTCSRTGGIRGGKPIT